ncbi:MAG: hypothetical protein M3M85_00925 [bacterium]|nr:hypothetical protein [bacterium]
MTALGPRPNYLLPNWEIVVAPDGKSAHLKGRVLFPASDVTISDRKHANVFHMIAVLWNAAHLLCAETGVSEPIATGVSASNLAMILSPEVEYGITVDAVIQGIDRKGRRRGFIAAAFLHNDVVVDQVSGTFVAV